MITESTMLKDIHNDDVLDVIKALNAQKSWTKEKYHLKDRLVKLLQAKDYISFYATNVQRYKISRVGESYLYDVPLYKQGHLLSFRGQRVRVVCTHSGRNSTRGYMANAVSATPLDKVVTKLTKLRYKYTFPAYVYDHEILYTSPRFIVFRVEPKLIILAEDVAGGYLDLDGYSAVLIDGKVGNPIATINYNEDGSVEGKLTKWLGVHTFPSLRCAIEKLSKRHESWFTGAE